MQAIDIVMMALALGAASGLKDTAQRAVTDLYEGLKALIQRKYSKVHLELVMTPKNWTGAIVNVQ